MGEADLIVIGAGAKAAAIAAKAHALNVVGAGPVSVTIFEAVEPAASWMGRNGMTSGEEPLAISPVKDVGFPYQSHELFAEQGTAIDRAMLRFSWQQYLISERRFARWVNAGGPTVKHSEYGRYLAWVLSRATEGVQLVSGRGRGISLLRGPDRWQVDVEASSLAGPHEAPALLLTGPGVHRPLSQDTGASARVFHCDSTRAELESIPSGSRVEIAIVGGGDSAISALAFLRASRPEASLTVYTPTLPMSRGESFLENRVFSNPDDVAWSSLDLRTRRDFIKHCDRGVLDPAALAEIASDDLCRFVTGRVDHVTEEDGQARLSYVSAAGVGTSYHDYVVNCTGFDVLEGVRGLLSAPDRAEIERRVGRPIWGQPADCEVFFGTALELDGLAPRLHIPGLAGLSQGPGFANLGCLGLMANRVLSPLANGAVASSSLAAGGTRVEPGVDSHMGDRA